MAELLVVNDLPAWIRNSIILWFADDTKINGKVLTNRIVVCYSKTWTSMEWSKYWHLGLLILTNATLCEMDTDVWLNTHWMTTSYKKWTMRNTWELLSITICSLQISERRVQQKPCKFLKWSKGISFQLTKTTTDCCLTVSYAHT